MATYDPTDGSILYSFIQTNGELTSGWTLRIPGHWTIAQIQRYLHELKEWA